MIERREVDDGTDMVSVAREYVFVPVYRADRGDSRAL